MSNKEILINEIVKELNEIPVIYLRTIFALIHSFKETIPFPQQFKTSDREEDFNWDSLLDEIHQNRKQTNLKMKNRMEVLLGEDDV